jgi:hypothetical protein
VPSRNCSGVSVSGSAKFRRGPAGSDRLLGPSRTVIRARHCGPDPSFGFQTACTVRCQCSAGGGDIKDFADSSIAQGSLLRVAPPSPSTFQRLRPGSSFSGVLLRPLFSQDREAVPVGSRIQLVVEKSEREKRAEKASHRLMSRLWNPLSTKPAAYSVEFRSAVLVLPDERTLPASVSFGRMFNSSQSRARPKPASSTSESSGEQLQNGTKGTQTLVESPSTIGKGCRQSSPNTDSEVGESDRPPLSSRGDAPEFARDKQATLAGNFLARVSLLTQLECVPKPRG